MSYDSKVASSPVVLDAELGMIQRGLMISEASAPIFKSQ